MKAYKDGWTVEGTPDEIAALLGGKPKAKPAEEKNGVDWGKAEALRDAGWALKDIASELKTSYSTLYRHFQKSE